MADTQDDQTFVSITELKEGMTITAYLGFGDKYQSIDDETCQWLKLNFKGVTIDVERDGNKSDLTTDQLQIGDKIDKIFNFPTTLTKITTVNGPLVNELQRRGFTKFAVRKTSSPPLSKQEIKANDIKNANQFVQNAKENLDLLYNATKAIETLMDDSRKGKTSFKEVKSFAGSLTDSKIAEAMSAIVSLKDNDHVYAHSVDVSMIFQSTYFDIIKQKGLTSAFADPEEAMLAAFLHDIGKAKIPKEILASTAVFEKGGDEIRQIRTHPGAGAKMLEEMEMPEIFINMAHYHHVRLDNTMLSSYPDGIEYDDLPIETKLLTLIDIYQALVAGRSYKKSWTPPAALRYLDAIAGVEYSLDLWNLFFEVMGIYPKGSLVKLNDGSLAFVIGAYKEVPVRPQVVVVRTAEGEDITHHTLLDLQDEQDMSIAKDVDVHTEFGEKALDVFFSIEVTS